MEIRNFEPATASNWDDFVSRDPESTIFHRAAWHGIISQSCPLRPYFLYASENEQVVGVLPLVYASSPIFGKNLISTPFCMRGGPLGNTGVKNALLERALEISRELKVNTLEIRAPIEIENGIEINDRHVYFTKAISSDDDENLKAIPRKQRAMVRKGIKAGLESRQENNLDNFFKIYATSVRNHGTPIFSRSYFEMLKSSLGEDCEITTVFKNDVAISSVMSFRFRNIIMPYYGGGLPEARANKAFDFMYWEVMRRAAAGGLEIFDYGRSKVGSGSYSFKKNWGFEPEVMRYTFSLVKHDEIPNRNPASEKYQIAVSTWKKLPLPVANRLGPIIAPYFA